MLDAVSSKLAACCSVRWERSLLPEAISLAVDATMSDVSLISPIKSFKLSTVEFKPSFTLPKVPEILSCNFFG
jgi:hypothetical protein